MARDITFGQFYPAESVVHKLDPRSKLLFIIIYITTVFLCEKWYAFLTVFLFLSTVLILSKIPIKTILKSVKGILVLLIFTSLLNILFIREGEVLFKIFTLPITTGGVGFAVKLCIRLILLIVGTSVLTLTTTPMALTDGIESLLKPLKYIRFPVHDFALIMSIALRFIPTLMEEVDKIMMAQKARGADFDTGSIFKRAKALLPVLIPLFVSSFRRADELALALDARCYNATPNRTKMKELKMRARDIIAFVVILIYLGLIIALKAGFWGLI